MPTGPVAIHSVSMGLAFYSTALFCGNVEVIVSDFWTVESFGDYHRAVPQGKLDKTAYWLLLSAAHLIKSRSAARKRRLRLSKPEVIRKVFSIPTSHRQPHPVNLIQPTSFSQSHSVNLIQSTASNQPHPVNFIQSTASNQPHPSNFSSQPHLINLIHPTSPVNLIQSTQPSQHHPSSSIIPPPNINAIHMEGTEEIQSDRSRGRRTVWAVLFFPPGFNEAAHKFKERYLKEN